VLLRQVLAGAPGPRGLLTAAAQPRTAPGDAPRILPRQARL